MVKRGYVDDIQGHHFEHLVDDTFNLLKDLTSKRNQCTTNIEHFLFIYLYCFLIKLRLFPFKSLYFGVAPEHPSSTRSAGDSPPVPQSGLHMQSAGSPKLYSDFQLIRRVIQDCS